MRLAYLGPFLICLIVGCATTKQTIEAKVTMLKKPKGVMQVVSSSHNEALAYDGAKVRAEEFCFKKKKDFVVLKEEAKYQGADKTVSGVAGAASAIFGGGGNKKSIDDYKVTMIVKCEGGYTGQGAPFAETLDLSQKSSSGWKFGS